MASSWLTEKPELVARRLAARRAWAQLKGAQDGDIDEAAVATLDPGEVAEAALRPSPSAHLRNEPQPSSADYRARLDAAADMHRQSRERMQSLFATLEQPGGKGTEEAAARFAAALADAMTTARDQQQTLRERFPTGVAWPESSPERIRELAEGVAHEVASPDGFFAIMDRLGPTAAVGDFPEPYRSQMEGLEKMAAGHIGTLERRRAGELAALFPWLLRTLPILIRGNRSEHAAAMGDLRARASWLQPIHALDSFDVVDPDDTDERTGALLAIAASAPGCESWRATAANALLADVTETVRTDAAHCLAALDAELIARNVRALKDAGVATNAFLQRLIHHALYSAPAAGGTEGPTAISALDGELDPGFIAALEQRDWTEAGRAAADVRDHNPALASIPLATLQLAVEPDAARLVAHLRSPVHDRVPRRARYHELMSRFAAGASPTMGAEGRDEIHADDVRLRLTGSGELSGLTLAPADLGLVECFSALYALDPARSLGAACPSRETDPKARAITVGLQRIRDEARVTLQLVHAMHRGHGMSGSDFAWLMRVTTARTRLIASRCCAVARLLPAHEPSVEPCPVHGIRH